MKHKQSRKFIGLAMALLLILAVPVRVLADECRYNLEEGSVTVSAGEAEQTVTQEKSEGLVTNRHSYEDTVVVYQSPGSEATQNTITINSENGATAKVTIENVNIRAEDKSGIDVQGESKAEITVKGENTVTTTVSDTEDKVAEDAAVHVSQGELTLTGGAGSKLTAGSDESTMAAAIGSNWYEAMEGKITIQGDLTVDASSYEGAGIGSGYVGAMTADSSISIQGNAQVTAKSEQGAGIGSGAHGAMTADSSISIQGNAQVTANGEMGAGIGSGFDGAMGGTITIGGNATVTASSDDPGSYSAGIGSGDSGDMSGSIFIQENATVTANSGYGAGIGSGDWSNMSGTVSIGGHANVTAGSVDGTSIGAGGEAYNGTRGEFQENASIEIKDNANVTVQKKDHDGNVIGDGIIGATQPSKSKGGFSIDSTAKLNGEKITDPSQLEKYGLKVDGGKVTVNVDEDSYVIPDPDTEPDEEEYKPGASLYWATGEDGTGVASKVTRKGDTMTVTTELENASLHMTRAGLNALQGQGVKTIVFTTTGATSSFEVAEVLAVLDSGNLVLTHKGADATLTLGGVEKNELLK